MNTFFITSPVFSLIKLTPFLQVFCVKSGVYNFIDLHNLADWDQSIFSSQGNRKNLFKLALEPLALLFRSPIVQLLGLFINSIHSFLNSASIDIELTVLAYFFHEMRGIHRLACGVLCRV